MNVAPENAVPGNVRDQALALFRADVLRGLRLPMKELPCKYFYDEAGSKLFERITELDEYYPTRTEMHIMRLHVADMARRLGQRCHLIEYGSGNGAKTRLLLEHLHDPVAYVPVDMSAEYLLQSATTLAAEFPRIEVTPLCADFTRAIQAPEPAEGVNRRVVYFPGSTMGNFTPAETVNLLRQTAALCGPHGGMLLGLDLQKDPKIIEAAYNDALGVTAAFNRNILVRINRELHADFAVDEFSHRAPYNRREHRIEMYLDSRRDQRVRLGADVFLLRAGEPIRTEYSYKFDLLAFGDLARTAGFALEDVWTDERKYFAVVYLACVDVVGHPTA